MAPPVRGPEAGVHWLTTPAGGVAPEALSWSDPADAREVSRSDKAAVHRVHIGGLEYYIKRFTGDWLGLRRLGLRQPAAATNFRIAHKIFLRGATTVPHLAAGWRRNGNAPGTSLLITGTLKGFVTADQWLQGAPLSLQSRRIFTRDIAHWLAHLHGAGISCHDLKYSNILVGRQEGRFAFALLDLDNCRVRFVNASAHDVQRNLHQLFRSFQKNLEPADVLCFLAEYRKAAGLSRQRARRIFAVVEKRLCRRGTGYRELRRRKTAVL